jgi:ATP-dependent DNA helicase UvrD/PcrA
MKPGELPFEDAPPEVVAAMGGRPPTLQQWRAISHDLSPCAVVAGAGSGKTAVMAARVVYLTITKAALPSQILCLTFTNKAAEELQNRVRNAVSGLGLPEGEEATVATYHSFSARLLDDYGLRMQLEAGPMLMTAAHKWQLATALFTDRTFEHLEVRTVAYTVRRMLQLADQCADHLVDPLELADVSQKFAETLVLKTKWDNDAKRAGFGRAELARLVAAYSERKRDIGVIDYGDQIALACRLVREYPEVVTDFRARFPIVLLDEFQDTNHAQAVLLSTLCGRDYPVMSVGDPDQNIYAWRGASLRNILRFAEDFGGEQKPLYVNFRSGSRILRAANIVIDKVPAERRGEDKELRPHESRGEGRVLAFVGTDERDEARGIARLIASERADSGRKYGAFAVLCRKKRLFAPIAEVFREEGIPVEVVDLGGLLQLPEVVEVVAWLRLIDDPSNNVALARVLQGPRWRIGYRDLVALARWSAARNRALKEEFGEAEHPGDVAFALAEALDNLDDAEMTGVSDEARARLREFGSLFASLRSAATGPLDELVTTILERSGLWRELEASASNASVSARRNLLNFVGSVSSFAPVEGESTLATLVSYLDAAEEAEEDFEQIQFSDDDTVKLMTIHKAKGLEWDVVFVPGLAESKRSKIFPDTTRQPNPITRAEHMPFALRGDRDVLPQYDGNIKKFREALKERGLEEERRLCYVALTRARDLLVVSSAYWYEGVQDPFWPSTFYEEVASDPACEELGPRPEQPADNPLVALRAERAATWPRSTPSTSDELFPEGWQAAAAAGADRSGDLPPEQRSLFDERLRSHLERLALVRSRTGSDGRPEAPTTLSVSALLTYERCPKMFYWSYVRPLPRRSSEAARIGTEVHRWIELQSRGQTALFDVEESPDLAPEESAGSGGARARSVPDLKEHWRASRFSSETPLAVERPFLLVLDGFVIGGRIDAIFGAPDGPWEVVDYKTGAVPSAHDPVAGLQLDLYALACQELWGKRPEDLTLTYAYIGEGEEVSRPAPPASEIRERVAATLRSVATDFEPVPGPQCRSCDFSMVCDAGRAWLDSDAAR